MYGFFADFVVFVHVLYVAYVVVGQLLIWVGWPLGWRWIRNFWFRITHLVAIAYVVYEQVMDIRCPLSIWEEHFRALAGQPTTGETFLGRMLHSLIFYNAEPWVFGVIYYTMGSLVLLTLLFCRPRWPFGKKSRNSEIAANSSGIG
jgi:hypothetical protein